MFNIVAKPVEGKCAARRCKGTEDLLEATTGIFLCEKHYNEWAHDNQPDLRLPVVKPSGNADMALVEAEQIQEAESAAQVLDLVRGLPNETQTDMDTLGGLGQDARARIKVLDAKRKTVTTPLNQAVKAANALFKPAINLYEECVKVLNGKITEAQTRAEAAQQEALAKVEAAGGVVDETTLVVATNPLELPEGASYREVVDFEITDESLVPRELWSPDPEKIKDFATGALKLNIKEAPGLRFFMRKILSQRSA